MDSRTPSANRAYDAGSATPCSSSRCEKLGDLRRRGRSDGGVSEEDPQRAAVARQLLDVHQVESLRAEDRVDRVEREVREVLVVDRVVLEVLDQLRKVGELERRRPVRARGASATPATKSLMSGTWASTLLPRTRSAGPRSAAESCAELGAEELRDRRHAAGHRSLGDVARRLDSQHRDPLRQEVLEEVAVVRGELDDEAVSPSESLSRDLIDVAPGVLDPRVRVRREVRVLREDLLGRGELGYLREPAALADADVQRIEGLALLELLSREHGLAQGRLSEVDDGQLQRGTAVATHVCPWNMPSTANAIHPRDHGRILLDAHALSSYPSPGGTRSLDRVMRSCARRAPR